MYLVLYGVKHMQYFLLGQRHISCKNHLICLNTEENYLPLLLIKIWHYCPDISSAAKRNSNELRYFRTIDADVNKFKIVLYVTIVFVVIKIYSCILMPILFIQCAKNVGGRFRLSELIFVAIDKSTG
eukprot:349738_1